MGTVDTGTLSQLLLKKFSSNLCWLLLWSVRWLGDPSKGNTSQGTNGATLDLLSQLSGVPGQVLEVALQPPITPMTPTSREGTSSHTFDQTLTTPTSQAETSSHTFGQVTACQVLLADQ